MLNRRIFLGAAGLVLGSPVAAIAALPDAPLPDAPLPDALVHKDPSCSCCGAWVEHLRKSGFRAEIVLEADVEPTKQRLGVPEPLWSCHTAEIGGYVIEGHVPAAAIHRLLAERPSVRGLAVPGMPIGSPGMEVPSQPPEVYDVVAFGPGGPTRFMRFRGATVMPG